ncbi:hypothetical protein HMPREF9120_01256 [Neisseria sp. oral taxon 020 str. F0370]|nr:hypothetical protein HMPREF9120_01256 [Neisseria sp. oral taxon 020 str. F0370]
MFFRRPCAVLQTTVGFGKPACETERPSETVIPTARLTPSPAPKRGGGDGRFQTACLEKQAV